MWFKLGPLKWCVDGDCVNLYDCFARKYVNEVLSLILSTFVHNSQDTCKF